MTIHLGKNLSAGAAANVLIIPRHVDEKLLENESHSTTTNV